MNVSAPTPTATHASWYGPRGACPVRSLAAPPASPKAPGHPMDPYDEEAATACPGQRDAVFSFLAFGSF